MLSTLYLTLHFIGNYKPGKYEALTPRNSRLEYLTGEELLVISELAKPETTVDPSSQKIAPTKADLLVRANIFKYIDNLYPDMEGMARANLHFYIRLLDLHNLKPLLIHYPIRIRSFFWLGSNWIYFELTFWALFGVMANLLYNTAEKLRKKNFTKKEIPIHIAKLLYSPFCVIIIYICYDTLHEQGAQYHDVQYTLYSLAVAFLLGFFSGRMIDLLNRIKDILLPLGKSPGNGDEDTATDPETEALPPATPEIIEEMIGEKGSEWVNSLPNVTGFAVRNKEMSGKETKDTALIFKVSKKEESPEFGAIPKFLKYKAKDGKKYKVITDVVEESVPSPNIVAINTSPFPLGSSVSRANSTGTGTIGLVVKKEGAVGERFIISCYHVLCAPELYKNNKTFIGTGNSAKVLCASFMDKGSNLIGYTTEGHMDKSSDFAVAKLNEGYDVDNLIYDWNIVPAGLGKVVPWDKGKTVKMCGRTSGKRSGKIKSHFAPQTIAYSGATQYFERLIEIERISEPGDSGAAVLDENNCIIGLLVGCSSVSSYILPVNDFINANNYFL